MLTTTEKMYTEALAGTLSLSLLYFVFKVVRESKYLLLFFFFVFFVFFFVVVVVVCVNTTLYLIINTRLIIKI